MKLFKLTLIIILSITMLTGCGGGSGGSSNPLDAYVEPGTDANFLADARYTGIVTSCSAMTEALVDVSDLVYDPSDDSAAKARTEVFMLNIADDFKTADGKTGSAALKLLRDYTSSRLNRYTVSKYTFTPVAHKTVDADTVEVTTHIYITLKKKSWAGGKVPGIADEYDGPYEGANPVVVWKKDSAGNWKIHSGLPKEMYGPIGGGD